MRKRRHTITVSVAVAVGTMIAMTVGGAQATAPSVAHLESATASAGSTCNGFPRYIAGSNAGIPEVPCLPADAVQVTQNGLDFDHVRTTVDKAKLKLALPPQSILNYQQLCVAFGAHWLKQCTMAEKRGYKLPTDPAVSSVLWMGAFAESWVESPPGASTEFGVFPAFTVHTVAFGSIPVTATVHIAQTMHDGLRDPLEFDWLQAQTAVPAGTVIPGYGPAPAWTDVNGTNAHFSYPSEISGSVTIRLSDVDVDGVPLNVGDDCATGATTLNLSAKGGYYNENQQVDQVGGRIPPGQPGSFDPIATVLPTSLAGSIDIPAFHHCGTGGDDVSRVISAMVSGPGNPIIAENTTILYDWCDPDPGSGRTEGHHDSLCSSTPVQEGLRTTIKPQARASVPQNPLKQIPQAILDKMAPRDRKNLIRAVNGLLPTS